MKIELLRTLNTSASTHKRARDHLISTDIIIEGTTLAINGSLAGALEMIVGNGIQLKSLK